ncbi:unnamed protein product [Allacma fusca]|uniref:Peptidase C45 hydrolase domain-containing protein n=1 Tax=Allacma fusca TaxID=39272 RepID=A0A8J2PZ73_9HEXA|nr:unnamed protein product [Allacma fusca]
MGRDPERNCDSQDPGQYDRIVVRGKPYDRGLSHGQQAKSKIHRSLQYYKSTFSVHLTWPECVGFVRDNYLPAIREYYPKGLDEMRGIADGANITLEDVLILNAREKVEEVTATPGECTGAVALKSATANRDVLMGQNWDVTEFILNNDTAILLEVHPDPEENIKPLVMLTEAGQLGRSGMNSNGLGIVAMGLWSTADIFTRDPVKHPKGWLPISLLRRMFLEAPTFSQGIRAVLQKPRHVSTNMIIATAEDEALNIELTPNDYFVMNIPLDKEILAHSNHFKTPAFQARDDIREGSRGSSSLFRDRRVEKALLSFWPNITEESFQTAFKDHVGYPNSVCQHSVPPELAYTSVFPKDTTAASIIFNLSQKKYSLCKGPPCTGTYRSYSLVSLPEDGKDNATLANSIPKTLDG